jgi:hypothetical protein
VVVDVNLRHRIGAAPDGGLSAPDRELGQYLQEVARSTSPKTSLVILAQPLQAVTSSVPAECLKRPPSFLDEFIGSEPSGPVRWASVRYHQDSDQVIRYWRLWETTCDLKLVPSVQWRAASFLRRGPSAAEGGPSRYETTPPRELALTDKPELSERITYTIPWQGGGGPRMKQIFIASTKTGTTTAHVMSREPFPTVLAGHHDDGPGASMLVVPALGVEQGLTGPHHVRNKVVVIGGSAELSRDTYVTPLGDMPGAVILINSIDSLVHRRQLHHLPKEAEFAIAAVLIVAVSVCFASLQHVWAYVLSCVVTLFALLPLSLVGFHRGYWLDFTLPLIAVQLHHMIAQVEEAIPGLDHEKGGSA